MNISTALGIVIDAADDWEAFMGDYGDDYTEETREALQVAISKVKKHTSELEEEAE